jgi:hypothetical protein
MFGINEGIYSPISPTNHHSGKKTFYIKIGSCLMVREWYW